LFQVLARASQRARVLVGGDNALHATARQYRRQHASADADIESQGLRRQRRLRDQIHILAAHRREHAVVRMDARLQCGNFHALLAPLVRADQAEQFPQRSHIGFVRNAVGFLAGQMHIGSAAQRNTMPRLERQQQHPQRAGALRLCLAMQVKGFGGRAGRRARLLGLALDTACQCLQQLACILVIAAP
jgi:hypothetical protein